MSDMSAVIIPKSDQLNADDLIAGPMTVKITQVTIRGGQEQPIAISFEGDNGKPYKACKSMCRVLVTAWGADSKKYIGRSMTLYRDPSVKWAGMEVGGIRISHLSHIDSKITLALTMTKSNRKPYTVLPLSTAPATSKAESSSEGSEPVAVGLVTPAQASELADLCEAAGCKPASILAAVGAADWEHFPAADYAELKETFRKRIRPSATGAANG